jgi:1-deoxy-D-xylulose-5-phosphate reductoisomerase
MAPADHPPVARPLQIAILGSTGSIGRRTLDVVRDLGPERARVRALVGHSNVDLLAEQAGEFRPALVGVTDGTSREAREPRWASMSPRQPPIIWGTEALVAAAELDGVDVVVVATVGSVGLEATLAAVRLGRKIALANKEVLVCAGELVTAAAAEHGAEILPIDSEHSAILQCLAGQRRESVRRLILTASGGPFRTASVEEIRRATRAEALAHPTWRMGAKITIDSATMMNKGFEVIEAHHLFGVPPEQIDVLNAANEIAVARFLAGDISLPEIPALIERAMDSHRHVPRPSLAEILEADRWARQEVQALCPSHT